MERTPDRRYEVRIFQTDARDPSDYYYAVKDVRRQQTIKKLSAGAATHATMALRKQRPFNGILQAAISP